jgi:hypothetical protein
VGAIRSSHCYGLQENSGGCHLWRFATMIEMRWYRDEDMLAGGEKPKLQYRHLLVKVVTKWYSDDIGGRVVPTDWRGDETHDEHWSEWIDVPDVTEPQGGE